MNVFVRLKFYYGKAPLARGGEHIDHRPIRSREGRHLRIKARRIQPFIQYGHILNHQRLQPAFRTEPPQSMFPRTLGMAHFTDAAKRAHESRGILLAQDSLFRPDPEHNFRSRENDPGDWARRARANSSP